MNKLPNPNESVPFEKEQGDYGYRTVDGLEEVVHLPTRRSNMTYYQPTQVLNADGCNHEFKAEDMSKRLLTCNRCNWSLTAHITQLEEDSDGLHVKVKQGRYKVHL